jgi:hypothetical protein
MAMFPDGVDVGDGPQGLLGARWVFQLHRYGFL